MICPNCQKNLATVSIWHLRDCKLVQETIDDAVEREKALAEGLVSKYGLHRRLVLVEEARSRCVRVRETHEEMLKANMTLEGCG